MVERSIFCQFAAIVKIVSVRCQNNNFRKEGIEIVKNMPAQHRDYSLQICDDEMLAALVSDEFCQELWMLDCFLQNLHVSNHALYTILQLYFFFHFLGILYLGMCKLH